MSHLLKTTSKVSTLDAAKTIYFIIVGLAIKQSLVLFTHEWPPHGLETLYPWWRWYDRVLVGLAFLSTVLRYSHGISLLYAYEKEQIEESVLPSRSRVFQLFIFLSCMGIFFFLLADTVASNFRNYLLFMLMMLALDFAFILKSNVVRKPFGFWNRWKHTVRGYAAHAALQWLASDAVLALICLGFLLAWNSYRRNYEVFAVVLLAVAIVDYMMNREFYFGGRQDRRKYKIVFVCSPLRGDGGDLAQNIRKAQRYCYELMEKKEGVIPLAPHCFFPYFLSDQDPKHRIRTRECAMAYLYACDAMYVYVPKDAAGNLMKKELSDGMKFQLDVAEQLGLEIQFHPQSSSDDLPINWNPSWREAVFQTGAIDQRMMDISWPRKRIYVCTELRGKEFSSKGNKNERTEEERKAEIEKQKKTLRTNMSSALYYCHTLTKGDATHEPEAAFAPQAYYPYFWNILSAAEEEGSVWEAFFERSLDLVKVCDAVYFYTQSGVPEDGDLSEGMKKIQAMARSLGIEIQHREAVNPPPEWAPCLPEYLVASPTNNKSGD